MSEYIKREDALEQFDYYDLGEYLTTQIRGMLMDIPSADVAPVRHGRWMKDSDGCLFCSICENTAELNPLSGEQMKTRYCNNCGARMDGGIDDE